MTTSKSYVSITRTEAKTATGIGPTSAVVLVIAAVLVTLSWLEPNHYDPWTAFQAQLAMAAGSLLFATWLVLRSWRGEPSAMPALAFVFVLAALVPWIQWRVGVVFFMGDAWITSLYLLGFALALTIGVRVAQVFGLARLLDMVAGVMLAAGLLSTWLSLYQWLQLDYLGHYAVGIDPGSRVVANLAQPNQLAMLLVVAAVAVGWLYASARVSGWCALITIAVLYIPMPMTGSRAGALASIVVVAWLLSARRVSERRLRPTAVLMAAAAAVAGTLVYFAANWLVGDGTSVRSLDSTASTGTRPIHWASMLDAISRRPWQGYGWNQVVAAQYEVAADHPASHEILGASHNLILDLFVANGVPLGFVLLVALVISLTAAMRGARSGVAVLAVAMILVVGVYTMLEFPHEYTFFLIPVGLLLGGLSGQLSSRATIRVHRSVPATLVALVWALLAITAHDYLNTEDNYRAFRFEQARIGLDLPRESPRPVLVLTQLTDFLRFARTDAKEHMSADELLWFEHVAKRYPNWTVLVRWASALAQNGQQDQARAVLSRVCKTHTEGPCTSAQRTWEYLGRDRPAVAAVPWPAPN